MRALLTVLLALLIPLPVGAQERSDPVLGERLIEGVATRDRLWVRNQAGAVVAFDRATGERRVLAETGVSDLLRTDGRTVALRADGDRPGRIAVVDIDDGRLLTPALTADGGSLLKIGNGWAVLTTNAVFTSDGGPWRRRGLRQEGRHFGVTTVGATPDGSFYFGYNQGEWGGGLWRIAPRATTPTEVRRLDGDDDCDGPLASACQPVTGIVNDPSDPACLLVSTGLVHMLADGAVLRVCGERVEVVFRETIPQPEGALVALSNTWPMFGLAATADGWAAVSAGKVFIGRGGTVQAVDFPELADWHGLGLAESEGFLILRTDVNWGMSLSGYTPLLVPVTD